MRKVIHWRIHYRRAIGDALEREGAPFPHPSAAFQVSKAPTTHNPQRAIVRSRQAAHCRTSATTVLRPSDSTSMRCCLARRSTPSSTTRTRRKHPTRSASSDAHPLSGPQAANCRGSASTLAARAHSRRARRPRLDPRTSLKRGSNTRKILPRQRVANSLPLGFALTAHTR